jgi:hypothetical protein
MTYWARLVGSLDADPTSSSAIRGAARKKALWVGAGVEE